MLLVLMKLQLLLKMFLIKIFFGIEGNHESNNDEKTLFSVFLLTLDLFINPMVVKDVYILVRFFVHFLVFIVFMSLPFAFRSYDKAH